MNVERALRRQQGVDFSSRRPAVASDLITHRAHHAQQTLAIIRRELPQLEGDLPLALSA
jgi:hypothetical protein